VIIILAKADQKFDYQILQLKQEAIQNTKHIAGTIRHRMGRSHFFTIVF